MPNAEGLDIFIGIIMGLIGVTGSAACAVRARSLGVSFSGACFLSIFCTSLVPVMGLMYFGDHKLAQLDLLFSFIPAGAFFGFLLGLILSELFKASQHALFFWLDSFGMGIQGVSAIGYISMANKLGPVALLFIGLFCGLAPGMLRDVLLGDVAMAVEQNWYASALAFGCMAALAYLFLVGNWMPDLSTSIVASAIGVVITASLRRIFGYRLAET